MSGKISWYPDRRDVEEMKFALAVTCGFRRVVKVYRRDELMITLIFSGRVDVTVSDVMDVLRLFDRLAGEGVRFEYF